jgi:hypothetical protein
MFVPLKENWINYLINRKPNILGSGIERNLSQYGQRQPDFTQLSRSPSKFGSAKQDPRVQAAFNTLAATEADVPSLEAAYLTGQLSADDLISTAKNWETYQLPELKGRTHQMGKPDVLAAADKWRAAKTASAQPTLKEMMTAVMPTLAKCATQNTAETLKELGNVLDLKKFLKQAGLETINALVRACQFAPQVASALDEFHGLDLVKEAIAAAKARDNAPKVASVLSEAPAQSPSQAGLTVITFDLTIQKKLPAGYSEEDQEKLLQDGVLIKDERDRDNVSIPYNIQVEKKLFSPSESGLYDILVKPGNIERCYVAVHPQGAAKRADFVTVVRTEGTPDWVNTRADQVFALARIEGADFDSWFDGLPEATSLPSGMNRVLLLNKKGDSTVPVRMIREYGKSEYGTTSYEVHLEDHSKYPPKGHISDCCYTDPLNYDKWRDGVRVHLGASKGSKLRSSMGDIFVPEGFKMLKCAPGEDDVADAEEAGQGACGCGESKDPPLMPGNLVDAQLALMQKTAALTVYHSGTSVTINKEAAVSPIKALVTLVEHHGLREAAAREILKTAAARRKYEGRVKYAEPYGSPMMVNSAPGAPTDPGPVMGGESIMGTTIPTQLGIDIGMPVPGMAASQTDRQIYNPNTMLDKKDIRSIVNAAQSGQREVFDTAMVGAMLRTVRDDGMVDRYMGELTKGLDKLGRILFMFYWHGDRFADRYGKADMPELEDSLRNAFEMLGDVILFLKQKTIEPYPEEAGSDVDLGPVANS